MIKKICMAVVLAASLTSCHAQNREAMKQEATDILGKLYENVQYCESAVNYHVGIKVGLCAFELLVNDMPVYRYDGSDGSGTIQMSAPINTNILKSGIQTWELRLYPPVANGRRMETLPENVKAELKVEALLFDSDGSMRYLSQPITLLTTPIIDKDGKSVFADAGKPEAIYRGTFEANVPYELTGWSRSKNLTECDSTQLKAQLITVYKEFRTLIQNGDLGEIARRILPRERETAQCLYYDKAKNEHYMNIFLEGFGQEGQKPYPLEKYKITYWGNGRMATLERTDMWFEPALATQYFVEGKEYTHTFYFYFHLPEGSEELEVIR